MCLATTQVSVSNNLGVVRTSDMEAYEKTVGKVELHSTRGTIRMHMRR
jgi:hypothetical protein